MDQFPHRMRGYLRDFRAATVDASLCEARACGLLLSRPASTPHLPEEGVYSCAAERGGVCCDRLKRATDYLLIDVSNSFTKLAFSSRKKLGAAKRWPTQGLSAGSLGKFMSEREVAHIVVCSVVPKKDALIRRAAGNAPLTFVTAKSKLGVGIDYPQPRTIGADRLANAAAVAALYGCPAVVVDFGTAVTFDVVSAERCYIGGVIAPGLEAMTSYLYNRTALLPKLSLAEPRRAVGKSTQAAMMSGAIFGYRGLVKEILARIARESFGRKKAQIVATGGYARLIAEKMPEINAVHPHLTLEGLRIIANLATR